jgi:GNAT superfamily N-acetyltransferase
MTLDRLYRSRGLFVFPEYRGFGIGQKLLMKTIAQAIHEKAIVCWSYPKKTAERSYNSQNFQSLGNLFNFQYEDDNIRAVRVLNQEDLENYLTPKE